MTAPITPWIPCPEAVALAKARPNYIQNVSEWAEWAGSMSPYYDKAEETTACAAIRILAADCEALEKERDGLLEACIVAVDELERCNVNTDSYGVHGSNFRICNICEAESGAGMLDKGIPHDPDCLIAKLTKAITAAKGAQE